MPVGVVVRVVALASAATQAEEPEEPASHTDERAQPQALSIPSAGKKQDVVIRMVHCWVSGICVVNSPGVSDGDDGGLVGPELALVRVAVVALAHSAVLMTRGSQKD